MFVSLLSVNEFVLTNDLSVQGVVTGSIIYSVAEEDGPSGSQLVKGATRRRSQIIRTAYDRMEKQARRLHASGVIGVRLTHQLRDKDLWEYTVQGTAVTGCDSGPNNRPFTCTLSGQEYFALAAAGYRPVGIAIGVSVYYQKFHQRVQQKIVNSGQNIERSDFTRGIYAGRHHAMTSLEEEATLLKADGVLGIEITMERKLNRQNGISQGMMIEFTAVGTAVVARESVLPRIDYALPLTD